MNLNKIQLVLKARKQFLNWKTLVDLYFKKIKNEFVILETKNELKIKLRTNSTDVMQLATVWLVEDYNLEGFKINDKDTVIDIGAHIGLFCLYVSQFCKNGKIYCYEPIKENYEILTENLELNKKQNIFPFNVAVSKENDLRKIFLNSDDSAHSILTKSENFVEVKSISIKSIFDENKIKKCDLLKLDCEGAEYEIIDSISQEYFDKINKIIIEYHSAIKNQELYNNLIKKLSDNSFELKIEKISDDMGMIYAKKSKA